MSTDIWGAQDGQPPGQHVLGLARAVEVIARRAAQSGSTEVMERAGW